MNRAPTIVRPTANNTLRGFAATASQQFTMPAVPPRAAAPAYTPYSILYTLFSAAVLSAQSCWVTLRSTYPLTAVTAVSTQAMVRRLGSPEA